MASERDAFFGSILHNRWCRGLLWIGGGCCWLNTLLGFDSKPNTPAAISFQGTLIDGQRRMAVMEGQTVHEGQTLRTKAGVFRVREIQPRLVVLASGRRRFQLELPKPWAFEKRWDPNSVAGR